MKINSFSTNESSGGAAKATFRLHDELRNLGIDSRLIVQDKITDFCHIEGPSSKFEKTIAKIRPTLDQVPLYSTGNINSTISPAWVPTFKNHQLFSNEVDFVHLHWINKGFIQIEALSKIKKPIMWTFHDTWPLTGGCHYPLGCERYMNRCGTCPQLDSNHDMDLSRWIWRRKSRAWNNLDITVVCPSRWMAGKARESSLFSSSRIETIAYGLDLNRFFPQKHEIPRHLLGFQKNKKLILFSAIQGPKNIYKGYKFLDEMFTRLSSDILSDEIEFVIMGSSEPNEDIQSKFPVTYLGFLRDEISLSLVYAAVDLFIAPSIADNLPNTILEALACGTPCVAFDVGGIPDQIDHMKNGYLAQPYEVSDFVHGIQWCLDNKEKWFELSENARLKAEKAFDIKEQAKKYIDLYQEILITRS